MASLTTIRKAALALPGVNETYYKGPVFRFGKKGFLYHFAAEDRWLFKLPHAQQELLWEVRPEAFSRFMAGPMIWSWVKIETLSPKEARAYVTDAWATVAPKKVSQPYFEAQKKKPRS